MNKKLFLTAVSAIVLLLLIVISVSLLEGSALNRNPGAIQPANPPSPTFQQTPVAAEYHVNLPNGLILVDSQGRRTGKDPAKGTIYREIPGTSYNEDGLSPANRVGELYFSEPSSDRYTLYLVGGNTGTFWLDASNNPGPSQIIRGTIEPGTMNVYSLNFTAADIASSTVVSLQGTTSSTVSITSAPPHNLPVPVPGRP